MTRTKQPASAQKLHQVLAPKLKQTVRSTKALTLPDDFELETSKRCDGRPASAQQPVSPPAHRTQPVLSMHSAAACTTHLRQRLPAFPPEWRAGNFVSSVGGACTDSCCCWLWMCRRRAPSSPWLSECVSSSSRRHRASSRGPQSQPATTRRSHPSPRPRCVYVCRQLC